MEFKQFNDLIKNKARKMQSEGTIFVSNAVGKTLWNIYLDSFKPGDDPIFRDPNSTSHTCNKDRAFIERYGNLVTITNDLEIDTIFNVDLPKESIYYVPAQNLHNYIVTHTIKSKFLEEYSFLDTGTNYQKVNRKMPLYRLGYDVTYKRFTKEEADKYGVVNTTDTYTFNHFHIEIEEMYINKDKYKSAASILSTSTSDYEVLLRGLTELPLDTLNLVNDLGKQGSLLDFTAHSTKLYSFIELKKEFEKIPLHKKALWVWRIVDSFKYPKFRNELIGVLCTELAEGKEINIACKTWNQRVDPANYMKAVAPITEAQRKLAQKLVEDKGYLESFDRRMATIDDIKMSEIMHASETKEKKVTIFDNIKTTKSTRHKRSEFDKVETVNIEKFIKDILPSCTSMEVLFENKHTKNLVAMTTSKNPDSKPMFKWSNNFSWTFNGNIAGASQLTKEVEKRGGSITGAFRFSHSWNELERNESLMDLHVFMPGCDLPKNFTGGPNINGRRVGWNRRKDSLSQGTQDVDHTSPANIGFIPVENITFPDINKMPEGKYVCMIHNWQFRRSGGKGRAEIAFGDNIYQYIYPATKNHEWVTIAEVTLKKGVFSIKHIIEPNELQEVDATVWGISTKEFHKVNLVCTSPNYWEGNNVGNKYYMFMLDNCLPDEALRGFHTENLNSELHEARKVLDYLGNTIKIDPVKGQLAGLGFNDTVRDELIVKLGGSFKRTIKITF